ncbi:hypothetical protein V3481_019475 [Fusarium oxysporum f. sp. vasinfectum]
MLEFIEHIGYTEIVIPSQLQAELDAADTVLQQGEPSKSSPAIKVPRDNITLYEFPQDPESSSRQNAAEKLVKEFWPGKLNPRFHWQFMDLLLEKGVLGTPIDHKNIYIPRPLPSGDQKRRVVIANGNKKSQKIVEWDSSKAYSLEPGVHILPFPPDNKPFRTWLLTIRCTGENMQRGTEAVETLGVSRDNCSR